VAQLQGQPPRLLSLWLFLGLFVLSLFAEVIANDKPIIARYKGELLFPIVVDYPESKFGGFLAVTDYKDPVILEELEEHGWAIWPPIGYSYRSINKDYPRVKNPSGQCLGFPGPPPWATRYGLCETPPAQLAATLRSAIAIGWAPTTRAATCWRG
jgi:microcin C transport system permease protein